MSVKIDLICRKHFIHAVEMALREYVKRDFSNEHASRAALFVLANSIWGNFYAQISTDSAADIPGKDQLFNTELKRFGPIIAKSLKHVTSWQNLYEIILGAFRAWLMSLDESEDLAPVTDIELREEALHFSEILFNACFSAGNPLRAPVQLDQAVAQMRDDYAAWTTRLSS